MSNIYHFLSGLPRTGSTLFSAILAQNPEVHAEGNSALCQLMWDTQQSCRTTAYQQLAANDKFDVVQSTLCSELPDAYYKSVKNKIVFDKCRSWTLPDNMDMVRSYISKNPKVVVLVRPIEEILTSFINLEINNGRTVDCPEIMLKEWSEPIMRSYNGVMAAKETGSDEFIFVDYDAMLVDPQKTMDRIYDFIDSPRFKHTFTGIEQQKPENDDIYGLKGMHDIRPYISKQKNNIQLSKDVFQKCKNLTEQLYDNLKTDS